jgi:hypothetical protein
MKTLFTTTLFTMMMTLSVLAQYDDPALNTQNNNNPKSPEFLISEDLYVIGSIGLGLDMYNGYPFGFSTIAMRENNLRILFDDTSVGGFPANDWQLTANSSESGGDNYFRLDDITAGTAPFTIQSGAGNHAIFVKRNNGYVGFGTDNPLLELHVKDGDTPSLRLEQDGSMGYSPQTFDIGGNEANFFIRDATNASALVFRIQPGTPGNTLTLKSGGKVGIGTWTPDHTLEVAGDMQVDSHFYFGDESTDGNWRVNVVAGKLTFEKREGGVWATKLEME